MVRGVFPVLLLLGLTGCAQLVAPSDLRPAPHPLLDLAPGADGGVTTTTTTPRWPDRADRATPAAAPSPTGPPPAAAATARAALTIRPAGPARAAKRAPRRRAVRLPRPARPAAATAAPTQSPAPAAPPRAATALAHVRVAGHRSPTRAAPARPSPAVALPPASRAPDPRVTAARAKARRQLEALAGVRLQRGREITHLALVRQALKDTGARASAARRVDDLWRATAPQHRAAEPGDLVFFRRAPTVPPVCVVRRRLEGGTIEAGCVARGAVRWVRLTPVQPGVRRRGGAVLNTFLRTRRAKDPPRAAYLAGELVWQIRTPYR